MDELKIKSKCEDMILYSEGKLRQYPRYEKRVGGLVDATKAAELELLKQIIICNHKYYKKTTMQDIDTALDMLRTFIRMAFKRQFINMKSYEIWSGQADEIGRMLGGWIKSSNNQRKEQAK